VTPSWILLSLATLATNALAPIDRCRLLAREIEGVQHAFLAGNHMYYIGGRFDAAWRQREHETIGLTHPFFRDGRARGYGIATGPGGTGHDKFGWDFWKHVRGAVGTVSIEGMRFERPRPTSMVWRPDRVTCTYALGGATVTEVKFISLEDVVCTRITTDRALTIELTGRSFVNIDRFPTFDGDAPGRRFSQARTAKGRFDKTGNAIHVTEGGTILTKLDWKTPAVVGRMMYDGMSVVISSTEPLARSRRILRDGEGRQVYSFTLACAPGRPVAVTYAMGDDYPDALKRTRRVLADPAAALAAKTRWFNELLNRQVPRFDCSDPAVVRTYYQLWSLYFMYFRHTGRGQEAYPHTQTAVNNFMGLHLWDSWAYAAMASWVVDKNAWGFGNVLSWKAMVPFKNANNALPDTFGVAWHSPGVWMNFVGAVEFAWDLYLKSGDRAFLRSAYDELFRPLYHDAPGPQPVMGIELNALACLIEMARALGRDDDVAHWQAMHPRMLKAFRAPWAQYRPGLYAPRGSRWKDIWHLASMMCREMPDEWVDAQCDRWVMNTETGFLGPVALRIRPPDCPPNGVFAVSSISTWLAVEGMFRHHRDADAVFCTLSHLRGMGRDFDFPVAPECWDPNHKPWGSQYYNWAGCFADLLLRQLAGVSYSIPHETFTVRDHLPESWSFCQTLVPVTRNGRTHWVRVRVELDRRPDGLRKTVSVRDCPLKQLVIEPWLAGRKLLHASAKPLPNAARGHRRFVFQAGADRTVTLRLGRTRAASKTFAVVTPTTRIFTDTVEVRAEGLEAGARLRFTTNGTDPTASSAPWRDPVRLDRTTTLTLRAFAADGTARAPMAVTFTRMKPLPARKVAGLRPGLRFSRYDGQWKRLPNMDRLAPARTGITKDLSLAPLAPARGGFAVRFDGYLDVPVTGLVRFGLRSDDGSRLRIDGRTVIELDVLCGRDPWEDHGSIPLAKGLHEITVEYFQAANRMTLDLSCALNGAKPIPVSPSMLFHKSE